MQRHRFPVKMALISATFMVPLLWLLWVYASNQQAQMAFAHQEREGVRYVQTVYGALEAAVQWQTGQSDGQQRLSTALSAVKALDAELGTAFKTSASMAQLQQAGDAAATTQALVALLDHVTDQSGLALDPDMASYHLMSAVLMRAPQVIQRTAALSALGTQAFVRQQLPTQTLTELHSHLAVVRHELRLARVSLQKVQQTAPDYANAIQTNAPDVTQAFDALITRSFVTNESVPQGDAQAFAEAARQTLQTQFAQVHKNLGVLDQLLQERQTTLQREWVLSLLLTAVSLLLAGYLFMGFYRSMTGGFKAVRRHLIAIAMGDLRGQIAGNGKDEVAGLLRELRNMQLSLQETVREVQQASDTVVNSSQEIAHGTSDLSARTEAAAAALEQSSASLEQTTSTVSMTAQAVQEASHIAVDNAKTASRGGEVMSNMVQTMERIQGSSQKISDIIAVIDGIAFQTNILALNAAVEAARAGEQGRGFAVVASEVRALAGRSAQAAKEIKTLIEHSTHEVTTGVHTVRQAGQTMNEMVGSAEHIKELLDEVSTGAREQAAGIQQIGQAVHDLDHSTQANAALVEQVSAAANAQSEAAVRMAAQVDEFRLPGHKAAALVEGVDVDSIIDAHRQWKTKLRDAIETGATVDTKTLSRDDCCALGKWIYADGQRLAQRSTFMELVGKHAHFHRVAGQVGDLINQRQFLQAEEALAPGTPFSRATSDVVMVLSAAKRRGF